MRNTSPRLKASGLVLLATTLIAIRQVLTKAGLSDVPPLTMMAGQAMVGALVLGLRFVVQRHALPRLSRAEWARLISVAVIGFTCSQTLLLIALARIPASELGFVLSFTPLASLFVGVAVLRDWPTRLQLAGMGLALAGAALFYPDWPDGNRLGAIAVLVLEMFAIGYGDNVGRSLLLRGRVTPVFLALVSMIVGSLLLAPLAIALEGVPRIDERGLIAITFGGLAIFGIALPFWNCALQDLRAFEAALLANLGVFEVAFLAWLVLGERLAPPMLAALAIALAGVSLVQLKDSGALIAFLRMRRSQSSTPD